MKLRAYQQGGLDGLCGIYAVVNSLRVLYDNSSSEFHRELFEHAARAIPKVEYPAVLWGGMTFDKLMLISRKVCRHLLKEYGHAVTVQAPFAKGKFDGKGTRDFLAAIAAEQARISHVVVIIGMAWPKGSGGGGHWSVLRRWTDTEIELFDSGNTPPLQIRNVRLGEGHSYRIIPHETILIKADTFARQC